MQWQGGRRSGNIEDRRGMRLGPGLVGGGLGSIVLVVLALFFGVDPGVIVDSNPDTSVDASGPSTAADDSTKDFVATVLGYTEDTWTDLFSRSGQNYREPTLVLYSGAVRSACGFGQAAMGPFYCSSDEKVYLDTGFFQELSSRFRAPGDFAQAYVIAHEVGHHVQNLLGTARQVDAMQRRSGKAGANQASVRLELQADCYAGVWANNTERLEQSKARQFLERGDVEEALGAASQIGDDKLQMQSRGYVVPESFTHGTAQQRVNWFKKGWESGSPAACDTFNTPEL
jgi:predicted metalloprotease